MKFTIILALAATALAFTRPKANEYKNSDCSDQNYGHNSFFLEDVTMDDTTKSVYLTDGSTLEGLSKGWFGYSKKTGDGGKCSGERLGRLPEKCVNVDTLASTRIKCVRSEVL
ncbi:hypothetical protein B0H65DRAFT_305153 [Neurospora tetraspora]|uniref:Uncharacterized protein n=1 Tax=Neurospora tetraspora TaxID=94610 RepID=A0AAE0MMD6_9PEZI|nr:hypothetical protein B0H65DRAFT_305153 [Neurospora tetraspora]